MLGHELLIERRHEYSRVLLCLAKRDLSSGGWLSTNVFQASRVEFRS